MHRSSREDCAAIYVHKLSAVITRACIRSLPEMVINNKVATHSLIGSDTRVRTKGIVETQSPASNCKRTRLLHSNQQFLRPDQLDSLLFIYLYHLKHQQKRKQQQDKINKKVDSLSVLGKSSHYLKTKSGSKKKAGRKQNGKVLIKKSSINQSSFAAVSKSFLRK